MAREVRFATGQMVMTSGVAEKMRDLEGFVDFVRDSISRHCRGDWGDLGEDDKAENEFALKEGNLRLFSAYEKEGLPKIYVITEADHSATTVLFPEEY